MKMPDLSMFIPLTKVDLQTRQVWGRATQEVLDGHSEIMDYASSAPYFKEWSLGVEKRSNGKSKGNIREMHQPLAAGKIIAMNFNDSEKAIDIGTMIVDDEAWKKVQEGVYTGFSVGGDYAKRWMDPQSRGVTRYTAKPQEISLVDAPAVPTAVFEMIKMDGTVEKRTFAKDHGPQFEIKITAGGGNDNDVQVETGEEEAEEQVEDIAEDFSAIDNLLDGMSDEQLAELDAQLEELDEEVDEAQGVEDSPEEEVAEMLAPEPAEEELKKGGDGEGTAASPGSGNHGHSGRPGKKGGSQPTLSSSARGQLREARLRQKERQKAKTVSQPAAAPEPVRTGPPKGTVKEDARPKPGAPPAPTGGYPPAAFPQASDPPTSPNYTTVPLTSPSLKDVMAKDGEQFVRDALHEYEVEFYGAAKAYAGDPKDPGTLLANVGYPSKMDDPYMQAIRDFSLSSLKFDENDSITLYRVGTPEAGQPASWSTDQASAEKNQPKGEDGAPADPNAQVTTQTFTREQLLVALPYDNEIMVKPVSQTKEVMSAAKMIKSHQTEMPGTEDMVKPLIPGVAPDGDVMIESGGTDGSVPNTQLSIEEVLGGGEVREVNDTDTFTAEMPGVHEVQILFKQAVTRYRKLVKDMGGRPLSSPHNENDKTVDTVKVKELEEAETVEKAAEPEEVTAESVTEGLQKAIRMYALKVNQVSSLRAQAAEDEKVVALLKQRGSRVGIARREGEPLAPLAGSSDDSGRYADPANWGWPIDNVDRARMAVKDFNLRKGLSVYSAREQNILGRRVARLASEMMGRGYQFNPVERSVEMEKDMPELKKKGDPAGLLSEVGKQLAAVADEIGNDPEKAKAMLDKAVAAMGTDEDVSAISPTAKKVPMSDTGKELGDAASMAPDVKKAAKTEDKALPVEDEAEVEKAKVVKEPDIEAVAEKEEAAEKEEETEDTRMPSYEKDMSAVMELVKKQSETMAAMAAQIEALQKSLEVNEQSNMDMIPIGDLAAILQNAEPEETELRKALNEGNLQKAFASVGNDQGRLYEEANRLFVESLAVTGINVQRYGIMPALQLIQEEPGK
jgi:hypothetical protein